MSLKPGSQVEEFYPEMNKGIGNSLDSRRSQSRPGMLKLAYIQDQLGTKAHREDGSQTADDRGRTPVSNGEDLALCSPPRTENEVLNEFVVTICRTREFNRRFCSCIVEAVFLKFMYSFVSLMK